jgi:hypothetical protein
MIGKAFQLVAAYRSCARQMDTTTLPPSFTKMKSGLKALFPLAIRQPRRIDLSNILGLHRDRGEETRDQCRQIGQTNSSRSHSPAATTITTAPNSTKGRKVSE